MQRGAGRRRGGALPLLLAAALVLAGCAPRQTGGGPHPAPPGARQTPGPTGLAAVQAAGTLRIGTDDTYPPMEFRDERGTLVGFDVDLGEELARRLGVGVQWVPTPWMDIIPGLQARRYDVILSAMEIIAAREGQVDFVEYLRSGHVIVVPRGNPKGIASLDDLAGRTVAVQIGTPNEDLARSVPGATVVTRSTYLDALVAVQQGTADAAILHEPAARYHVALEPGVFEAAGPALGRVPLGIAVHEADDDLGEAIAAALEAVKADGTFARLYRKWFGQEYPGD